MWRRDPLLRDAIVEMMRISISFMEALANRPHFALGNFSYLEWRAYKPISDGKNDASEKGKLMRDVKKSISSAIEIERANKLIGSSLEANVKVYSDYVDGLRQFDLEELAIVSKV
jgi:hypothetical protein